MHGGVAKDDLKKENVEALKKGLANLGRHIENVKKFGVPIAVAINHFISDTDAEIEAVQRLLQGAMASKPSSAPTGPRAARASRRWPSTWRSSPTRAPRSSSRSMTRDLPLWDKVKTIAREIYRADDIVADKSVRDQLKAFEAQGYGKFPICMAKTQYSFSTDPNLKGAPTNHVVPIREVRLSAGAEFIVVICGDIMTMPGLPKVPSAEVIGLDDKGQIAGLF